MSNISSSMLSCGHEPLFNPREILIQNKPEQDCRFARAVYRSPIAKVHFVILSGRGIWIDPLSLDWNLKSSKLSMWA
jgi:hypothetical protein